MIAIVAMAARQIALSPPWALRLTTHSLSICPKTKAKFLKPWGAMQGRALRTYCFLLKFVTSKRPIDVTG